VGGGGGSPFLALACWCCRRCRLCLLPPLLVFELRFLAARLRPKEDEDEGGKDDGDGYDKGQLQGHCDAEGWVTALRLLLRGF